MTAGIVHAGVPVRASRRGLARCFHVVAVALLLLGAVEQVDAQEAGPRQEARSVVDAGVTATQEQAPGEHESGEEDFKRHKIIFMYGTTWVPQGDPHGERPGLMVVPTLGVDYEFWLTHKIALGVLNDFELSSYVVEGHEGEEFEREYAYVLVVAFIYEPIPNLSLFLGPGGEFEKNHNFFVFRVGAEYGIPIRNHWDVGFSVSYDYKDEYDSVGFGVLFGKRF